MHSVSSLAPTAEIQRPARARRPYLYALDPIRVVTALSVLAVHVFEFSSVLNASPVAAQIQVGASSALHFTREVFMFTTAFVLVYTYAGKSFDVMTFLRKRGITVVVPYVLWSAVYVWFNAAMQQTSLSPLRYMLTTAKSVLMGDASYQLYFILLSIQFYALFPLLLRMLPWLRRHARLVLTLSFLVELALLSFDFVFLENRHAAPVFATVWATRIDYYQDRFVLVYQFYFLLGALLALHVERVSAFLLAHGRAIAVAFALTLGAFWLNVVFAVGLGHDTVEYATAVLQPAMVPYTLVVLAFLGWLAVRWAPPPQTGEPAAKPRGAQLWNTLAESTFGIYLVHPLFLTLALAFVVPALPSGVPAPLRVLALLLLVAGVSVGASIALLRTPGLSGLVGRPSPLPTRGQLRERLATGRASVADRWSHLTAAMRARVESPTAEDSLALAGVSATLAPLLSAPTKPLGGTAGDSGAIASSATQWSSGPSSDARDEPPGSGIRTAPKADAAISRGTLRNAMREREQRLRRAWELKQDGWRQREIAAELGVSRSTISYWLKRSNPEDAGVPLGKLTGRESITGSDAAAHSGEEAVGRVHRSAATTTPMRGGSEQA